MATSLVSTGLQFPDSTIQTTAATAGGGSIEAVASGSLANGDLVVINTDGTVSVVSESTSNVDPPTTTTPDEFNPASTSDLAVGYDSANDKIVIAYKDSSVNKGYAVVGTVSGSTISFGTPVEFSSVAISYTSIAYIPSVNKVIITYNNNNSTGSSIVGTVSGTSISFGSPITFVSDSVAYTATVYDSNLDKVIVFYRLGSNGYGYGVLGNVEESNISFGTPVAFNSAGTSYISAAYDPVSTRPVVVYSNAGVTGEALICFPAGTSMTFPWSANTILASTIAYTSTVATGTGKIIVAYRDANLGPYYGRAVVGSVSSTAVTFGTAVTYSASETDPSSIAYDSIGSKAVVAFRDVTNSGAGKVVPLTLSGTSTLTVGSATTFNASSTLYLSALFVDKYAKTVLAYKDNSNYGQATLVETTSRTRSLTSENYIGISNGAYSDSETATIQVAGAVDDAQTGLTAGQAYYVQNDGTLSTTPDDPSVFAGTAVSSTKIIVKG